MLNENDLHTIERYFEKIKTVIQYTKSKDTIINNQGEELARYRDGFIAASFRSFAVSLIDFRESAKKDLLSTGKYVFDSVKVKKNLAFLVDDFNDLLSQNGIEIRDDRFFYGGAEVGEQMMFISETEEEKADEGQARPNESVSQVDEGILSDASVCENEGSLFFCDGSETESAGDVSSDCEDETEKPEEIENASPIDGGETVESLIERYQKEFVNEIRKCEALEKAYASVAAKAAESDAENRRVFIFPVVRILTGLFKKVNCKAIAFTAAEAPLTDEGAVDVYKDILSDVIAGIQKALVIMGVSIVVTDDVFNPQQHRLVKVVNTDEAEKDRSICAKLTDAYSFEGKMIYLQKTEVYKYKKQ